MANEPNTVEMNNVPVGEGANGAAPPPNPETVQQQPPPQDVSALNGRPPVQQPVLQDPLESHPAVQHASVLHKVAETLAGGPKTITKIDPMTGTVTREKQPLTGKQIWAGALANILSTFGQTATAFADYRQHRNPPPIRPLPTQAAEQQQAQQAQEDFEQAQNQRVRQAKVMTANLEAMRAAYAIGKENDEAKDSVIQNHSDDLSNWQKSGAVEASNVPSNELMKKGFDKTKYVAIPDGRVPIFNPDGTRATDASGVPLSQLTYSVVDGTTQAPLSQDKYDQLAKYGLVGTKEGFKLPEGATISTAQLALMNHKLDLIQQTQRELDEVHDAIGGPKVDLALQIKKNPQMLSAIEKFHNDGSSTEPDNQINNLQAKFPQAAGLMRELFGNDNLEKYKENRLARTKAEATKQEEQAREEVRSGTPEGQQKLKNQQLQAEKTQLEIDKMKKDQNANVLPTGQVVNGVDQTAMNALPEGEQRLAKTLMAGRMELTPQSMRTAFGAGWAEKLATLFPGDATHEGFDATKFKTYEKVRQDYTSGKAFNRIQSSNNALEHLGQYLKASQYLSTLPGVKTLSEYGTFGKQAQDAVKQREAAIEYIATEAAKATKGGAPDKDEIKRNRDILENELPSTSASAAKAIANIIKTPLDSLQAGWESGVPFGDVSPLTHLMSPQAAKAYTELTGETPKWAGRPVEPTQQTGGGGELIQNKDQQNPQNAQPKPQQVVPAGASPVTVNGQVTGYVVNGVYKPF